MRKNEGDMKNEGHTVFVQKRDDTTRNVEIPFVCVKVREVRYHCFEKTLKITYILSKTFPKKGFANQILIS